MTQILKTTNFSELTRCAIRFFSGTAQAGIFPITLAACASTCQRQSDGQVLGQKYFLRAGAEQAPE